ncbi:hypothetical protein [Halobellus rufus]|uniref:hypothetical protein n=1 Tax=Halobellus rufus TaxID=1448860 RepID=UPI0018CE2D47|nr:hypothetical protein [Halobellus rufus]
MASVSNILNVTVHNSLLIYYLPVTVILASLLLYSVSKLWVDKVSAGLAVTLLLTSSEFIFYGVQPQPTLMGLLLFIIFLYSLSAYFTSGLSKYLPILGISFIAILLAHQITPFIVVISTLCIFLGVAVSMWKFSTTKIVMKSAYVCLSLYILYITYFSTMKYLGPNSSRTFFEFAVNRIYTTLLVDSAKRPEIALDISELGFAVTGAPSHSIITVFGTAVLFALATTGSVTLLRGNNHQSTLIALGTGIPIAVLSGFTFVAPLVDADLFISTRWLPFLYVVLVIPGGLGVSILYTGIISKSSKSNIGIAVLILILIPYITVMGGTDRGAPDGPLSNAPTDERFTIEQSEEQMIDFVVRYANSRVLYGDNRIIPIFERKYGLNASAQRLEYQSGELVVNMRSGLHISREYIYTESNLILLQYNDAEVTIRGPFPKESIPVRSQSSIYTNGKDTITTYHNTL